MKKPIKKAPRKLSKTEKSIANKISYNKRKIKALKIQMEDTRAAANYNPENIIKDSEGKLRKQKTIESEFANMATKLSSANYLLEQKRVKRFKKYKPKSKLINVSKKIDSGNFEYLNSYTAWEKNDFFDEIEITDYQKVMGKKVDDDMNLIIDKITDIFLLMGSEDLLTAYGHENYNDLIYEVNHDPDGVKEKRG